MIVQAQWLLLGFCFFFFFIVTIFNLDGMKTVFTVHSKVLGGQNEFGRFSFCTFPAAEDFCCLYMCQLCTRWSVKFCTT